MDIDVSADGYLVFDGKSVRCAIGRGGISARKTEGDGVTPVGCFPLRHVLYRPDRIAKLNTRLPVQPIQTADGWCDDPGDVNYNKPVTLPYPASAENLWREDGLYDVIVVLGHNDAPVVPAAGSAIFLHVARPDFGPTEGCVAVALPDLCDLLTRCAPTDRICITAPDAHQR
ncbi:MAG: L,D-transpeptidase family protein [Alphaproteobacteria bacterium]|nr:L,D-transpeptidase family protein [Alphaproteobacteria bacterium]